jgi:endonuclease YncB( thermonuclease family)
MWNGGAFPGPNFRLAPDMRIAQIQPMRARWTYTTKWLAAFVPAASLTVALALGETMRLPAAHHGQGPLLGVASVIDGDTIALGGAHIRLEGIDAPEAGQTCGTPARGNWACGTAAGRALARLIEGKQLRCEPRGLDKYGRTLGVCFLGTQDVNAWMVRQGHAWAFVKYSTSYVREEAQARAERAGIWQGAATPAWEYRARRWARAETQAPRGCAIKGNVTANGKIYHMPWSPWYAQIKMDAHRGRRWFCTEAEAIAAGWRPVNVH